MRQGTKRAFTALGFIFTAFLAWTLLSINCHIFPSECSSAGGRWGGKVLQALKPVYRAVKGKNDE